MLLESIEPAELRKLKFIEVRGFSNGSGEVEIKDYTNFEDNFGTFFSYEHI